MSQKYIIIKYLIFFLFNFHFVNSEIIFVYENCRHGVRGPLIKFKSSNLDNNTLYYDEFNIFWEGGKEDLTLKGKIQMYILGIRNRYYYPNLINYTKYNSDEILVHVSRSIRVKKSAYYHLLGMFNPIITKNNTNIITNISNKFYYPPNYNIWQKISNNIDMNIINEAELSIKYLLEDNNANKFFENDKNHYTYHQYSKNRTFYVKNKCKNYDKYMEHNYKNKYKKLIQDNLEKKYGNIFKTYFKYDKSDYLYNIRNSSTLIDNYIVNYYEEKNLSDFFYKTKIDKEEFYKTSLLIYEWWLYNIVADDKICMIESSKIMKDLIEYFENKINNKNKINIVIDLGHDITVGSMQNFMHQVFGVEYYNCQFACNLFFELHKDKDKYYIKYFIDEKLMLNINYEIFKKKVIEKIWSQKDIDNFCFGNVILILYPNLYLFLTFLIMTLIIFIFVFISCKYYKECLKMKKTNKKGEKYNEENKENSKELELL